MVPQGVHAPAALPVSAKLALPLPRPGAVERLALLELLDGASPASVVTVLAPAGYGKTTLLQQWAARLPRVAYVRLDPADDDPRRLLGILAAAVRTLVPLPDAFFGQLDRLGGVLQSGVVAQFVDLLWAHRDPFVLLLDDVHEVTGLDAVDVLG